MKKIVVKYRNGILLLILFVISILISLLATYEVKKKREDLLSYNYQEKSVIIGLDLHKL